MNPATKITFIPNAQPFNFLGSYSLVGIGKFNLLVGLPVGGVIIGNSLGLGFRRFLALYIVQTYSLTRLNWQPYPDTDCIVTLVCLETQNPIVKYG